MEKWRELVNDPIISEFVNSHKGAEERIISASKKLADDADALAALRKLLPALDQQVINVFFSYKKEDEVAAKAIVDLLRTHAANKLNITYQAAFTQEIAGKKWREKIRSAVCNANWFILLLPDPSNDWDWPLYEAGLFEAQVSPADRLICMHREEVEIPSQIEGYHAIAVNNAEEVRKFLHMVYLNEHPVPGLEPLNPNIANKVPELTAEFVGAISPLKQTLSHKVFEPWIKLRIKDPANLKTRDDLDHAEILSANKTALDLFDFMEAPPTWGRLRSTIPESTGDGRWREELFHVIRRIAGKRKFYPIQAVFQSHVGKMYRPVAYAIDQRGDKEGAIESFHITFTEEIGALDSSGMPREIFVLVTTLRFAFRFRWEVLEKFSQIRISEADVARLDCALKRIEIDWQSRGMTDENTLKRLFSPNDAERITEMSAAWHRLRNPEHTGELDLAIREKDTEKIPELLARVVPMNQEFLEMATDCFSKMIQRRLKPQTGEQHGPRDFVNSQANQLHI